MPHLTLEYSANLDADLDMTGLCAALRDALEASGLFPVGGIRVRALRAEAFAVADGAPGNAFIDMTLRIGAGRDAETRAGAREALYAAAESILRPRIGDRPFALSLELREMAPEGQEKRWNTLHDAVRDAG